MATTISYEDGLRAAIKLARAQADLFRKAGIARDAAGDSVNGGRFIAKGLGASEVANGLEAMIERMPEDTLSE